MRQDVLELIKQLSIADTKTLSQKSNKLFEEGGELAKNILPYESAAGTLHRIVHKNKMLGEACAYYESLRYTQVEVPWIVNELFVTMTSPTGNVGCAMGLNDGNSYLVCSAEQGFVRQWVVGELPKKKHMFSVSPCFRDEELDDTHSKYFMKLELFSYGDEKWARKHEQSYIVAAFNFFNSVGAKDLKVIDTPIGFDILSGGLEIGSYGVRNLMGNEWCAYGTGLALPRISLATGDI